MPVGPPLQSTQPPTPGSFPHAGAYGSDNFVSQPSGAPVPAGTPATVYQIGGTTLATLYVDRNRTGVAPNPTTLASLGNLRFYADPDDYDVLVDGTRLRITAHPYPLDTLPGSSTGTPGTLDPDAVAAMFVAQAPVSATYRDVSTGGDGTVLLALGDIGSANVDATIATVNSDGTINGADGTTPADGTLATHLFVNRANDIVMTIRDRRYVANSIQYAPAGFNPATDKPSTLVFTPSTLLGMSSGGVFGLIPFSAVGGGSGMAADVNGDYAFGTGTVSGGVGPNIVHGGVIRSTPAINLTTSQTVTANSGVNDFSIGTSILAHMDQVLDNNAFVVGPIGFSYSDGPHLAGQTSNMKFPMAAIEVEGTVTYQQSASGFGGAGVGFQCLKVIKNAPGLVRNISGHQGFLNVPVYVADGATIAFAALTGENSVDGVVGIHQGFCDWPLFGTDRTNGGTLNSAVIVSYESQATFASGAVGDMRWGFKYEDAQTSMNIPAAPPGGANILGINTFGFLWKQTAVHIPHLQGAVGSIGIHNGSTTVFSPPAPVTVPAGTPVPSDTTHVYIQAAGLVPASTTVVTTASPQIVGGWEDGQHLWVTNTDLSSRPFQFGNGRGLQLPAANNLTLRPGQTAEFVWWAAGTQWILCGRSQGGFIDTGTVVGGGSLKIVDGTANSLSMVVYGADGDLHPKLLVGTRGGNPELRFGAGGATALDTTLGRTAAGVVSSTAWETTGLTGTTSVTRWVGGTNGAAPASGAHTLGDWAVDIAGRMWICVISGTPGSWVQSGSVYAEGTNIVLGTATGTKIGTATNQKLGFYNKTPIVQPAAPPADATDLATALTLVNALKAIIRNLGLAA